MTLDEYFADKPRGAKVALANKLGVSKTWMSLLVSGREQPSAGLALMIEKFTKGAVTRKTLRPDLFGEIK
jgi:DNA-binding transcriptional regulator YdaS (Cro superfamily)